MPSPTSSRAPLSPSPPLLSLRHLSATRLGFTALPPVVPALTSLAHLDLSGNAGMECGREAGGGGLCALTRLTAVLLAGVAPGGPPPEALAALPSLEILDLGADPGGGAAFPAAAAGPRPAGGGGGVMMVGEGEGAGGAPPPAEFLPPLPPAGLPALVALDLSGRPLGPTSLAVLASGLAASTALARLSLAGCGPGVGPALPPALARHAPSLVALDCSHCGLVSLPAWLGRATRLVSLDVRANPGLALRGDGSGGREGGGGEEAEGAAAAAHAPPPPAPSLFSPPPAPPPDPASIDDVAALAAIAARHGGRLALAKAGDAGWGGEVPAAAGPAPARAPPPLLLLGGPAGPGGGRAGPAAVIPGGDGEGAGRGGGGPGGGGRRRWCRGAGAGCLKERRGEERERERNGSSLHTPRTAAVRSLLSRLFCCRIVCPFCLVCLLSELVPCPSPLEPKHEEKEGEGTSAHVPSLVLPSLPPPARPPALPSRRRRALPHRLRRQQAVQDLLEDGLLELWRCDKREK